MTWVITAAAVTGTAALVGAVGEKRAAEQEAIELETQADQERVAAEGAELRRRQDLNKVLAQNVVGQSISGISGEGTPSSISLESAKQASVSEGLEDLSTRLREAQLKRRAKSARQTGDIRAASTLLSGGGRVASLGID